MAEKIVEVPGVGNVSFPDTMSDDDIGAAISRNQPKPSLTADMLSQRQAASKAAFEANQPSLTRGFLSEALQNTKRMGSKLMNTEPQINAQQEAAKSNLGDVLGIPYSGKALDVASALWPSPGGVTLPTGVANAIPSAARAGENFQTIMGAAKDVPINTSLAEDIAVRAKELSQRGQSLPKVFRDFIRNKPLTYESGRDFASAAGRLSADEATKMAPAMQAQVGQLADALKTANREAAASVGMGDLYDAAINEYRQSQKLGNAVDIAKKYLTRAAIGGAIGGSATAAGYGIKKALGY